MSESNSENQPKGVFESGETILVTTKPFYTSKTLIGLLVLIVTGLINHFSYKLPESIRGEVTQYLLNAVQWIVGPGLILWGRWSAKQPLGVSDDFKKITLQILLLGLILFGAGGCMSYTRAEHAAWRETVYSAVKNQLSEHAQWSRALAGEPGATLPDLSTLSDEQRGVWLRARLGVFEKTVEVFEEDRNYDKTNLFQK